MLNAVKEQSRQILINYTGALKPKLHLVCLGNPSLTLRYFKRFTKFTLLHFQNKQNTHTHKTLKSHKNHNNTSRKPLADLKNYQTHTKPEKDQTSVVAQPCLPQTPSPSFKHKLKAPRIDLRSIFSGCNLNDHERERIHWFPKQFRTKKFCYLSFENHNTYSQTVTKQVDFQINPLISLDLSEISQLKNKSSD